MSNQKSSSVSVVGDNNHLEAPEGSLSHGQEGDIDEESAPSNHEDPMMASEHEATTTNMDGDHNAIGVSDHAPAATNSGSSLTIDSTSSASSVRSINTEDQINLKLAQTPVWRENPFSQVRVRLKLTNLLLARKRILILPSRNESFICD